jgi:cobalt-zinc-cadmium efflux system outer membrane protein
MNLTNNLANNFQNYITNLEAVEYYRRYVLPDQVIAYRGTLLRRQIDINAQFGDLVAAQQSLATSVTTYLGLLGSLWTSVVSVADMLQTDDLFQNAEASRLPELPDLESLPPLPCCHPYSHNGTSPTPPTMLSVPTPLSPTQPSTPMPMPGSMPAIPPAKGQGATLPPAQVSTGPTWLSQTPAILPTMGQAPSTPLSIGQAPMTPPSMGQVPVMPPSMGQAPLMPASTPVPSDQWQQGPGLVPGLMFIPGLMQTGR